MSAWLNQHRDALRIALRRLAANPVNTLLSLLAIGVALALPLAGVMLFSNTQQLARGTAAVPQISLFMKIDADRKTVAEIEKQLKQNPAIESARFLPRETTLAHMRQAEGLSDVIDALPRNPFPDAFVITPVATSADDMERLAKALGQWPQIDHVQIDTAWIKRLNAMLQLGRTALLALSVMIGFGLIAITFNTIRLQMITLKNEIDVSRLLGATDAFISRPFLYFGILQGALGALIAWSIVAVSTMAVQAPTMELARLYGLDLTLSLLNAGAVAILLSVAIGLGWLGAWLSLSQHLRRSVLQ